MLPNIGRTLSNKLVKSGIESQYALKQIGSEKALIKVAALKNSGVCINMLYTLEAGIQGIRWHKLSEESKLELKYFYRLMQCSRPF